MKVFKKIIIIFLALYLAAFILLIDPLHDYMVFPTEVYENLEYYLHGDYVRFPGGESAASFFPKQETLPADCLLSFTYEDPRHRATNLWSLQGVITRERLSHKYYLNLSFDTEDAYRAYKMSLFGKYDFASSPKITRMSLEKDDKILYAVFDGESYGGIFFDDADQIVKYVYIYQYDGKYYDVAEACTHYSTGFCDIS